MGKGLEDMWNNNTICKMKQNIIIKEKPMCTPIDSLQLECRLWQKTSVLNAPSA